jgi:hypothetical protein
MNAAVISLAVADSGAIFAGLYPHGLQILYQGASRTYLSDREVSVASDGRWVYVGTDLDLQVIDANRLGPPLPTDLPVIGRYSDSYGRFYYDLSAQDDFVHSPTGIFFWEIDLLMRALSAGVTVNGTTLASGSSVAIYPGDHVGLPASDGVARLYVRCTAGEEETLADLRWTGRETFRPYGLLGIASAVGRFNSRACELTQLSASPAEDTPALPLTLESGGVGFNVLTTAGVIEVGTPNASSQAGSGTRFEAGHDPDLGKSRWVCLAGALQVQPTAAGAPPLTLYPMQFVDVTAAGAEPIGQFHFAYLPLVLR